MTLKAKHDMGFLRHHSLNWKVSFKKSRSHVKRLLDRTLRSTLSNYAIPSEVAPQQSFCPLYVTVNTKVIILKDYKYFFNLELLTSLMSNE